MKINFSIDTESSDPLRSARLRKFLKSSVIGASAISSTVFALIVGGVLIQKQLHPEQYKTAASATVAPVTLDMSRAVPLAWCDSFNHATGPVSVPAGFKGNIFDAFAACDGGIAVK